jgi:1-acyl-sn-glycerol-3-phosphate acyltransferase
VVKESLVRYPVFGAIMRARDPITVGRTNPREDLVAVLTGGEERLKRGISVIVFPQGTRHPEVEPLQFNSLGAKLAARARVPLVPVALDTRAWGTGRRLKDVGPLYPAIPVRFRFGAALPPSGRGNENHDAAVRFIVETVTSWRNQSAPGA